MTAIEPIEPIEPIQLSKSGLRASPLSMVSAEALSAPASGIIEVTNYGRSKPGVIPLWAGESDLWPEGPMSKLSDLIDNFNMSYVLATTHTIVYKAAQ